MGERERENGTDGEGKMSEVLLHLCALVLFIVARLVRVWGEGEREGGRREGEGGRGKEGGREKKNRRKYC